MSHSHAHHPGGFRWRMAVSALITFAFVIFEALAGFYSNSLALLTDAAHNLTDVVALALSWFALRLAEQPPHAGKTFGYHRVGILAAMVNSTTLGVIALGIFYESYHRLQAPPPVAADVLAAVAGAALAVNLLTAWLVHHGSEHDLNVRSAFIHLMGDVFSTLGAIAAGIGIWFTGWTWLDPAASILIGLLILWNAWIILSEVLDILLESTPKDIDMDAVVRDFLGVDGVLGIHDLHVWSISRGLRMLSAHVVTGDITLGEGARIQHELHERLAHNHGIGHATLQLEFERCASEALYCNITAHTHHGHDHHH
ncbi:MAG: cation transporter [Methylococcaceae bacterium]|nr:cation transporter [Methylococcaceae bacterium]